jgi:hypothetical protein
MVEPKRLSSYQRSSILTLCLTANVRVDRHGRRYAETKQAERSNMESLPPFTRKVQTAKPFWGKTYFPFLMFVVIIISSTTACSVNNTQRIVDDLKPAEMMSTYNTKPRNLAARSKCSAPPSVKIVNVETNNKDYLYYSYLATQAFITPQKVTEGIVGYMNDAFNRSGIKPDHDSAKVIQVSMGEVKSWYNNFYVFHSNTQLKISIPEIEFSEIYEHFESSPQGAFKAIAFGIHLITWQVVSDAIIQNYVLCR